MTTRRSFLATILAAATAPAFIKAEVLMKPAPIWVPPAPAEGGFLLPQGLPGQLISVEAWESSDYGMVHSRIATATINGEIFGAGVKVRTPTGRPDAGHELEFQRHIARWTESLAVQNHGKTS